MDIVMILWFLLETTSAQMTSYIDEENVKTVSGLAQGSVKLSCKGDPTFDPLSASVYWYDTVYNSDEDAALIFSSINNSDFNPNPNHPNAMHYLIEFDFSLTINSLDLESDPGYYFCVVELDTNNVTFRRSYDLTVFAPPECHGQEEVTEKEAVELTCFTKHSGKLLPKLRWLRGEDITHGKSVVEVRKTTKKISFEASWKDNQMKYVCQMTYGDNVVEECSKTLLVNFFVRDLIIEPAKHTFFVKEEIKCSAKGNPLPKIQFGPIMTSPSKGISRFKSIQIPNSWADQAINLICIATNSFNGHTKNKTQNMTIEVRVRPEERISKAIGDAFDQTYLVLTAIIVVASVLLVVIFICVVIRKRQKRKLNRTAHLRKEPVRV